MENEEKFSVDTENLKKETKDTVNQVKDSIKNVDFKKDTEETKGFIKEMIANPFEAVKRVATGEENVLKKVIIIMIIYIAASLTYQIISFIKYGSYGGVMDKIMDFVTAVTYPIFYVLAPSIVILILNKNSKKNLITILSTIVVAAVPVVVNNVINVLEVLVSGISLVTGPISTALSALATIITYFGMKDLFEIEEHKNFIKKYAIIRLVASFILTILVRIGIA